MKLSEKLSRDHESGNFGNALEGYAEQAEELESAQQWQPIETAPKDGTEIDVWNASAECRVVNASWSDGMWIADDAPSSDEDDVTHWMPLPKAPNA